MVESFLALQLSQLYQRYLAAMSPQKLALWLNQDVYMSVIFTKHLLPTEKNSPGSLLLVKPLPYGSITYDYFLALHRHVCSFLINTLKMPANCTENIFIFSSLSENYIRVTLENFCSTLYEKASNAHTNLLID
ncbi:hypothetical protein [Chlamydiifrater volucris]|uniref:hypothetical protein n=1 Tax=Chlamydiifrater volucris TaxID=2681470 RepID=UPI001BD0CF3B|nr:hypothetical protein [Chlamydiifrater volucris]